MLRLMKTKSRATTVAAFVTFAISGGDAFGQRGPPVPLGMDVHKAAVGSYADYEMTVSGAPPMKLRLALVGRDGSNSIVETIAEGGMASMMGGKMVARLVLDKTLSP